MTTRTEATLQHIERLSAEVDPVVDQITPEQWHATTTAEGWPIGSAVRHIANGYETVKGWVEAGQARRPHHSDPEAIHRGNAEGLVAYSTNGPTGKPKLLRERQAALRTLVSSLPEADLDTLALVSTNGDHRRVELVLITLLDAHTHSHLDSIRATLRLQLASA